MDETRYYELRSTWGPDGECIRWGLSRFGKKHDAEMDAAVSTGKNLGDGTSLCVSFTPVIPRMKSAAAVQAHRIRNMRARAAKLPLLAAQIEAEELAKPYFSIEQAERDQAERLAYFEKWAAQWWADHTPDKQVHLPNASVTGAKRTVDAVLDKEVGP